jgi:RND superfamily putative drug exporter
VRGPGVAGRPSARALVATVVLSFAAALGVSALAFDHVFGFAGADTSFPLWTFVFLVALGVDTTSSS